MLNSSPGSISVGLIFNPAVWKTAGAGGSIRPGVTVQVEPVHPTRDTVVISSSSVHNPIVLQVPATGAKWDIITLNILHLLAY
jgi:hypothetical protein